MRVNSINNNQNNFSFGRFVDNGAVTIAQDMVKKGHLSQTCYNRLKETDVVHIVSSDKTLQGKPNEELLEKVDKYDKEVFLTHITSDILKNMEEGNKLEIATAWSEYIDDIMNGDEHPEPIGTVGDPLREHMQRNLAMDIYR